MQLHERSWSSTSARGVLCANCYVQTGCANWYVQNDIFACNFLNNGPILIKKNLFESSRSPLSTPGALVQLHERSWSAMCKLLCANWLCKLLVQLSMSARAAPRALVQLHEPPSWNLHDLIFVFNCQLSILGQ